MYKFKRFTPRVTMGNASRHAQKLKDKMMETAASMKKLKLMKMIKEYDLNSAQMQKAREFKKSLIDSFASGESKNELTEAETQTITEQIEKKIPNIFKKFDKKKLPIRMVGEALKTAGAGAALAAGTLVISPFILVGLILTAVVQLHNVMVNGGSKTRRRRRKKAKKNRKTHKENKKEKLIKENIKENKKEKLAVDC